MRKQRVFVAVCACMLTMASIFPGTVLAVTPTYYGTYLGGDDDDYARSVAVDSEGNVYVTGYTTSTDFDYTEDGYDTTLNGACDAFVVKLTSDLSNIIYGTFLGGSGSDYGEGIAVDSNGLIYVTGYTNSSNFPTTRGAYDTTLSGSWDAFVTTLNINTGLAYSTYLGGSDNDYGYDLAQYNGSAYVVGDTLSNNFPTTTNGYDRTYNGNGDVFITKLNSSGTGLTYSTYLGGSSSDNGRAIALRIGDAYVTGYTNSNDFPTSVDAYDTSYNGETDAFATKVWGLTTTYPYSTYLGGSGSDYGYGIDVDDADLNNAFVTGQTTSSNFPTTAYAYKTTLSGGSDAFVTKLNWTGTSIFYSTYLGGTAYEAGYSVAVNFTADNALVTGFITSTDYPTSDDALDDNLNGTQDAFVTELSFNGSELYYSSYLGGNGTEYGHDIAIQLTYGEYVTGDTNSTNFPTHDDTWQEINDGGWDAFVSRFETI